MTDPLCDRPEEWNWLHRDAEGNGLLVGPNCPDCERRAVARYRCLVCGQTFDIPGVFRWSWQGKGHTGTSPTMRTGGTEPSPSISPFTTARAGLCLQER